MTSETRPASKLTRCRVCGCKLKSGDICPRCEREHEWLNTPEYFCASSLCGRFLPGATEPGLCPACERQSKVPEKPLRKPIKIETKSEPQEVTMLTSKSTETCPVCGRRLTKNGHCFSCAMKRRRNRAKTYPAPSAPLAPKTGAETLCNEAPQIFTHGLSDVRPAVCHGNKISAGVTKSTSIWNGQVAEGGVVVKTEDIPEPAASTIHAAPPPHTMQPTAQPDLYRLALRKFGDRSQIMKTAEEAAELSAAITRYLSPVWNGKNPLPGLIEELADVEIMCRQMRLIFGEQMVDDAVRQKLARLERRLAE